MTFCKRISQLCLISLLALAFGCSSSPTKEGTGEFVDDAVITTKVKAELLKDPLLKSAEINVETFKGVVQLSGFVATQAEIGMAADVARKIQGATDVRNDVQLKTKTTTTNEGAAEYVEDSAITAKVKAALLKDPALKSAEISVETFKGVVQLTGFVGYQTESKTAAELARKTEGVKSVKNDIRIKGQQ